jgi:membrane protease YdiL (CAAX protease family)
MRTWVFVAAGAAFLVGRLFLVGHAVLAVPVLFVGYGVLLACSLSGRTKDETAPRHLPAIVVLGFGGVALLAARAATGPAIPIRTGLIAVAFGIVAAIGEEAFFRRYIYGTLERRGIVLAVMVSAALFALVHVPLYGMAALPIDLAAGLLFSWQRWASGRWTVPAATHAAANVLAAIR